MHIKDIRVFWAVTLVCALLAGCDKAKDIPSNSMDNAVHVANSYFQALENEAFNKAIGYIKNSTAKANCKAIS